MTPSGLREHSLDLPIGLRHRLGDGNVVSSLRCMNDPQPEGHMASYIRRRKFLATVGGAAAWPLAARAQQPDRMRRIGVLLSTREGDPQRRAQLAALVHRLTELGWADGRNARLDVRWTAGSADAARKYAAELVALAPDVIITDTSFDVAAVQQATRTVPIVFGGV